jgi:hypothetical protein
MALLFQILFSLAIADIAVAILMWTLAVLVPSLDNVAPKHLKLVTSSSFSPLMVMSALVSFELFIMTLAFSILTSMS